MTYEELWHRLTSTYDAGEAKAIVRWVLEVRFGLSLADILCGKVTQLSADDQTELGKIMHRLEKGEPVQYIIGVADFCGRQFHVEPGVLIPRPETAELCEWIIKSEEREVGSHKCHVLDIGTGSGCIAITLALDMPDSQVTSWDISETALCVARKNAQTLGADITLEKQNALGISRPSYCSPHTFKWDLIVSNPPYITLPERDGMEKNVLDYEPEEALFAPKDDSIIFYRRIADYASWALKPEGRLYFELNPLTAEAVRSYLEEAGFSDIEIYNDQFGKHRFLKAKKR